MKLLALTTDYNDTIQMSKNLHGNYHDSVIFHCYWNGNLNEKHFYSILSCYYFNVFNNKHQIVLWLENNTPNHYNEKIEKYCEIRQFSLEKEKDNTTFVPKEFFYNKVLSYYSDNEEEGEVVLTAESIKLDISISDKYHVYNFVDLGVSYESLNG